MLPTAQHLWATDSRWWKHHKYVPEFKGKKWTQEVDWTDKPKDHGINSFKANTGAGGLSVDPEVIHTGRNSGYAAIGLAYHLGAERVLLLGYDMKMRGEDRHWFGAHPEGMDVASDYNGFVNQFRTICPSEYGIEIWNVTRDTALLHFPVYDLDDVVTRL